MPDCPGIAQEPHGTSSERSPHRTPLKDTNGISGQRNGVRGHQGLRRDQLDFLQLMRKGQSGAYELNEEVMFLDQGEAPGC